MKIKKGYWFISMMYLAFIIEMIGIFTREAPLINVGTILLLLFSTLYFLLPNKILKEYCGDW